MTDGEVEVKFCNAFVDQDTNPIPLARETGSGFAHFESDRFLPKTA
jgi:hypothetical protein